MSANDPLLDRAIIEHAFYRLGDRLARRGIVYVAPGGNAAVPRVFDPPGSMP
ncbi:MAG: hypothetical protein WCF33_00030 [Pseudonocardiaceae bacterium]